MDYKLAKCARCEKLFNKIVSEVCNNCQPDEDADFNRIHDVISRIRGLNAHDVADEAGVDITCVFRMLREGRIDNIESNETATCGRCGAKAISATKRLCEHCLIDLDRECAHAMMEMRQRIRSKSESDMNDVQAAVMNKRASKKERRESQIPVTAEKDSTQKRRMVVQERLRRK